MHLRLRELANPSNPPLYPPHINVDTLNKPAHRFSDYLKTEVIKSCMDMCIMDDCYVCDNSKLIQVAYLFHFKHVKIACTTLTVVYNIFYLFIILFSNKLAAYARSHTRHVLPHFG